MKRQDIRNKRVTFAVLEISGSRIGFGFDVSVTECLSISSSSEVVDDELAGEGGVVDRGLEEAILLRLEINTGSLTLRV